MHNVHFNETQPMPAFILIYLGWIQSSWIKEIDPTQSGDQSQSVTLKDTRVAPSGGNYNVARIKIPGGGTNEHFIIENRQGTGSDVYLSSGGKGLIIWHLNKSYTTYNFGGGMDVEIATAIGDHGEDWLDNGVGSGEERGFTTDFFNPTNKSQFTPWTNPSTETGYSYSGSHAPSGLAMTNIDYSSGTDMTFDFVEDFSSGQITEDSWWEGTIDITGDITVASGKTLTISANTTVDFAADAKLIVNGTLQAAGTSQQRITLDRSGGSGTWGGIEFNSGSSGTIGYTTIDHAAKGVKATSTDNVTINNASIIQNFTEQAVYASNSSITVQNSTIQDPDDASHGIYVLGGSSNPTISGNTIDGPTIGIEREDNPGAATIENNTIINCTNGIKTTQSAPTIRKNAFYGNIYGIRLATGSSPNIHDNDFYDNAIGVLLDQSQPAQIKWNNFGWSGSIDVHADEGIMVFYLNGGNTFLSGKWNNFYDGDVTKDISNPTGTMLNATGNYWYSLSVAGNVDTSSPQGSHNNDAGPGGASTSKVAPKLAMTRCGPSERFPRPSPWNRTSPTHSTPVR